MPIGLAGLSAVPGGYMEGMSEAAQAELNRQKMIQALQLRQAQGGQWRAMDQLFGGGGGPGGPPASAMPPGVRSPPGPSRPPPAAAGPAIDPRMSQNFGGRDPTVVSRTDIPPDVSIAQMLRAGDPRPLGPATASPQGPGGPPGPTAPQPPAGPGGAPQALSWPAIVRAAKQANPGAPPEVLAQVVDSFLPMMQQQSRADWQAMSMEAKMAQLEAGVYKAELAARM